MDKRDLKLLDMLEVKNLTIGDISGLKNGVLRQALVAAIVDLISASDAGAEHTNHWAHTNHGKTMLLDPHLVTRLAER